MIFKSYTGNAMLNNALMTIEALAGLKNVSEITPEVLLKQFQERKLWELNRRLKSYTMLFTRNGPLLNDAKLGENIYRQLTGKILANLEREGEHQCEISGLRFKTTFANWYAQVLRDLKVSEKEIENKDRTINRCWFPLIGALGSDAQALPQAKFDIRIHPVCLVIIQFLPFSSLLYKGGVLLFDAANFEFARDFIAKSVERVLSEIEATATDKPIENIKDFDKGKYLLRAIELFAQKQNYYGDRQTDINLWSFTNSGTGASCEVDRVPSRVFRDLLHLYKKSDCQFDLKKILNGGYANNFVNALKNGYDYEGLYPKKDYEGVSIPFFEEYQRLIGRADHLTYAKFIAGLMKRATLAKGDEKILAKTDAFNQQEYAPLFQKVLIEAAGHGEWSLAHHLDILDDPEALPVQSFTKGIFKKVHFYFQKFGEWEPAPSIEPGDKLETTLTGKICAFAIRLIEKDGEENFKSHQKTLKNLQEFNGFSLAPTLVRQCRELTLSQASTFLFHNYRLPHYGLNFLLRVYFSQKEKTPLPEVILPPGEMTPWLDRLEAFAEFYTAYYQEKYEGDWRKFNKHVLNPFPKYPNEFQRWLDNAFQNMRSFYEEAEPPQPEIEQKICFFEENLCYDEAGNYNPVFARFAVQFCLNQQYHFQPSPNQ
jgi:hypothetical protein